MIIKLTVVVAVVVHKRASGLYECKRGSGVFNMQEVNSPHSGELKTFDNALLCLKNRLSNISGNFNGKSRTLPQPPPTQTKKTFGYSPAPSNIVSFNAM